MKKTIRIRLQNKQMKFNLGSWRLLQIFMRQSTDPHNDECSNEIYVGGYSEIHRSWSSIIVNTFIRPKNFELSESFWIGGHFGIAASLLNTSMRNSTTQDMAKVDKCQTDEKMKDK